MKIKILSPGQWKQSPHKDVYELYRKRIHWNISLIEMKCDAKSSKSLSIVAEYRKLIPPKSIQIVLDERGKNISSDDWVLLFKNYQIQSQSEFCILIGGADGLPEEVKEKSHHKLSFGQCTWPHLMIRSMLIEQIYRAQQIIAGHPYHK